MYEKSLNYMCIGMRAASISKLTLYIRNYFEKVSQHPFFNKTCCESFYINGLNQEQYFLEVFKDSNSNAVVVARDMQNPDAIFFVARDAEAIAFNVFAKNLSMYQ